MDEKLPKILPKVATSTSLLGSFTCRKFTTWDRPLYFPSEGRGAEDFFARKIRQLRPGLNPRTWVPKASTLASRPPKPLFNNYWNLMFDVFYVLTQAVYRLATRNSHREWQYHMLHVYNCILLKMSTWGSKHVEENSILWINNNQCIKLVINI